MERLTYDFALGGNHCWQVKGADNLECREVCERQGDDGCKTCPIAKAFDRLAAYEDTGLEPEAVEHLKLASMGRAVAEITEFEGIPIDRLRELAQADRERRCVVLPCKKGDVVWRIVHDATPHITKDRCTDITLVGGDVWVRLIGDMKMGAWNFGRLLFTTRADAEAALRREQDGNRI